jgi:quinohemoprotein ethanol dehydrogenase
VLNPEGKKQNISRILAFKIGGDAELPPKPEMPAIAAVPDDFGTDAQVNAGAALYARYCSVCHGVAVMSGGALPDLRHSAMTSTSEAFHSIVLEGALLDKGMASFAEVLSTDDAEAVRAYVVRQAQ